MISLEKRPVSRALGQLLDCQVCLLCGQTLWQEQGRLPGWLSKNTGQPAWDLSQLTAWLCPSCLARLPLHTEGWQRLPGSGIPLAFVFTYEDPIRQAFLKLKFSGQRLAADLLALAAAFRLRQLGYRPQGLIPLPLGPRRLKERGYNQATLICRSLAPLIGAEVLDACLIRVRETPPQTRMPSAAARRANVRGAFALHPAFDIRSWRTRPLLLVDDIFTSGASLGEGARLVWQAQLPVRAMALGQDLFSPSLTQKSVNTL